jgi:hypothetical protein
VNGRRLWSIDRLGTGPIWGDGVQHRTTRSNDLETAVFVVVLFALLLVVTLFVGSPVG